MVVGAGCVGLHALPELRSRGITALVREAGSDVGGTRCWNRCPGARCDLAASRPARREPRRRGGTG